MTEQNTMTELETNNDKLDNSEDLEDVTKYPGKWYVINCYSGHEDRVRDDLIQRVESLNMKDVVFDIRVVKETVLAKKTKATEKNVYPGYIFINMIMNDEAWYIVRNTTGVTGFIGSSGRGTKPFPLTDQEAKTMLSKSLAAKKAAAQQGKKVKKVFVANFEVNDYVRILSGTFVEMEGQVTKIDTSKGIATVNLEMFGRLTPTEVDFDQCEKIG
ncbi:transcription antitermination protein NusG [Spiroplasma sp. NBRC 100390]|uniref:transcription termination/antitermination protein NusG n=1 Tax=unclassified Spiroplasma TaxID=2637901 RepID=UPI00089286A3|nr:MULTISPECIES: transcription termination/antitermination protein NusG [unclassified Spiroplasma]AOX43500.1 transcription antitermination protein NusG [Spiroplasma sp. TU-14]APE12970.1 transcription antitermination protein NusG [Spiroplasma sp. NBRC 100390]